MKKRCLLCKYAEVPTYTRSDGIEELDYSKPLICTNQKSDNVEVKDSGLCKLFVLDKSLENDIQMGVLK